MHGIFARPSSQPLRSTFRAVRPLLFVGHASKSQGPGPGGKDFCQTTRVGTARLPYTLLHALMLPLEPHCLLRLLWQGLVGAHVLTEPEVR